VHAPHIKRPIDIFARMITSSLETLETTSAYRAGKLYPPDIFFVVTRTSDFLEFLATRRAHRALFAIKRPHALYAFTIATQSFRLESERDERQWPLLHDLVADAVDRQDALRFFRAFSMFLPSQTRERPSSWRGATPIAERSWTMRPLSDSWSSDTWRNERLEVVFVAR